MAKAFRKTGERRGTKWAFVVAVSLGAAAVVTSVAIATHESGHSREVGSGLQQVKIVRHSFPVSVYPGGQWSTSSGDWVDVPGAQTTITVPSVYCVTNSRG